MIAMERYWRFAKDLFPPLGDGDGMSEQQIADAEALVDELVQDHLAAGADPDEDFDDADLDDEDLDDADLVDAPGVDGRRGFRLPAALREICRRSGGREDMHRHHDRLLAPGLEIEDGHLLIYQENQSVCVWGIRVSDLALSDPPVYLSYEGDAAWRLDHDHLSDFLCFSLLWQRVNAEPCEFVQLAADALSRVTATWEPVPLPGYHRPGDLRVFRRPGVVAMAYPSADRGFTLQVGAREPAALTAAVTELRAR